jgi:N-acetylmuramoyl-L-alanine amidase
MNTEQVVENLDVRPSQRNAELLLRKVQPSQSKLNTESADTKKTASKQDTTQILFLRYRFLQAEENGFGTSDFKGLRNISMDYENSAYKYMYGETLIMMSLRTF